MSDHAELIEALGDGQKLAERLSSLLGEEVGRQKVYNWKRLGVAQPYRFAVAQLAEQDGLALPPGFIKGA